MKHLEGIPEPSLRRLPVYYTYLKKLAEKGVDSVSCTQIAEELNLVSVQIRKDLAITGIAGKPKIGYSTSELLHAIEAFLGWNNATDAILVGAGHLGAALLGYAGFQACGLNILVAFDNDPDKINTQIYGKRILPLEKLPSLVRRLNIHIGILTVPEDAAPAMARLLVTSGIKAIWNFSSSKLQVPNPVIVQHENLASSLAVLSKRLERQLTLGQEGTHENKLAQV